MQNLNMQKSKSISNQQILKKYINARAELIQAFCDKQEFEDFQIIHNTMVEVADFYFDLNDIILDLEKKAPKGVIIDWYYYNLDLYESTKQNVNYRSYLMGWRKPIEAAPKTLINNWD